MSSTERYREIVDAKLVELRSVQASYLREKKALAEVEERREALVEARTLAQGVAQAMQNRVHSKIARIVSKALEAVFPDPYEFRISFEQKRGRTEAVLSFVREGEEVDPLSSAGGGAVDVASFALRLAALLLSRPAQRRVLILDEPFRFVSAGYRANVAEMLRVLSEELDVQLVLVTHDPQLVLGKSVQI